MATSDPFDRLASLRVEMTPGAQERHLEVISEAVRTAPPVRTRKRLGFRRRWAVAIASLTAFVAPVGTAVAAEGALPGELLYPVKQVSEQVRAVFDEDVPARHRVEELERFVDAESEAAVVAEAQRRAEEAVGALDQPGELAGRLDRVRQRVRNRYADDPAFAPPDGPNRDEPGNGPGGTVAPGPGPGSGGEGGSGDGPGPGAPSGDPDQDRDRDGSGDGGGGSTPSTSAGNEGGSSGGGSRSGGSGGGGSGSGSGGTGSGGSGSGDGGPGSGDGDGSGSNGDGSSGGGSGSGSAAP